MASNPSNDFEKAKDARDWNFQTFTVLQCRYYFGQAKSQSCFTTCLVFRGLVVRLIWILGRHALICFLKGLTLSFSSYDLDLTSRGSRGLEGDRLLSARKINKLVNKADKN